MSTQVIIVLILTVIISIIATLAYSVRIVGVKTGRIAIASAVFSIFALISRTANSIQAPLLSKKIENTILIGNAENLLYIFRWILFATTVATIIGALLMATLLMVIFVDPYVSMLTDDVIKGKCTEFQFNRCIIFIVGGLIVGTISAQLLLVPAAQAISFIAKII